MKWTPYFGLFLFYKTKSRTGKFITIFKTLAAIAFFMIIFEERQIFKILDLKINILLIIFFKLLCFYIYSLRELKWM